MATNALFNKHCPANIRLAFIFSGGGSVEYDYRIFKEDSKVKVLITNIRR